MRELVREGFAPAAVPPVLARAAAFDEDSLNADE